MGLPRKLIIAGHTITVLYKKKIMLDGKDVWAYYDDERHRIYMTMGMERSRKMEVFLHECIHAISFIHGLNMTEKAVDHLGIELLALVRNNKIDIRKEI